MVQKVKEFAKSYEDSVKSMIMCKIPGSYFAVIEVGPILQKALQKLSARHGIPPCRDIVCH